MLFQSTRPARGATSGKVVYHPQVRISIHAPREGRDLKRHNARARRRNFNPRAPRGARHSRSDSRLYGDRHFNPRAPRGARHTDTDRDGQRNTISIHAPREGRDVVPVDDATVVGVFQSTRPARGATKDNQPFVPAFTISIHAPREGRDARRTAPPHARNHFNPRAPRGARQVPRQRYGVQYQISIHAPREGRDMTTTRRATAR